ncbi:type II toxin-antitoxin system VapC family toxin [Microbacterium sp.]|uniref:type II toxin-antitoxin system VapC family toxin n=1 Tax=Microbacterium sp. TaxID=51671 RepID=UPI0039E72A4E
MILLDTNALLWVYRDSARLGPQSRALITASDRTYFSSVSVMEIVIKAMLGRLEPPGDGDATAAFTRSGLVELPFTAPHAAAMAERPALARHDPFDRMLLAQASEERMVLLTSDAVLLGLGEPGIRDAAL